MALYKIPDGWLDCKSVGKVVQGSRFIAIKTPLDDNYDHWLKPEEKFTLEDAVLMAEKTTGRKVGMMIDLNFTKRYYDESLMPEGVEYLKLRVPSAQSPPPSDMVEEFKNTVSKFYRDNESNDKVILVYCIKGVDRTGYFVCKYLIDKENVPADTAIQRFNDARGYCIEEKNYIEDLKTKSK